MPSSPTPKWSDLRSLPALTIFNNQLKTRQFSITGVRSDRILRQAGRPSPQQGCLFLQGSQDNLRSWLRPSLVPYLLPFCSWMFLEVKDHPLSLPYVCITSVTFFPSHLSYSLPFVSVVNIDSPMHIFCLPYALFVHSNCARPCYGIINAIIARKMQLFKTDRSEIKDHSSRSARSRLFLHSGRSPSTWPLTLEIRLERGDRLWTKWPQSYHCHQMLSV